MGQIFNSCNHQHAYRLYDECHLGHVQWSHTLLGRFQCKRQYHIAFLLATIMIFGVGLELNSEACASGIYLCIAFYTSSKMFIYMFLSMVFCTPVQCIMLMFFDRQLKRCTLSGLLDVERFGLDHLFTSFVVRGYYSISEFSLISSSVCRIISHLDAVSC